MMIENKNWRKRLLSLVLCFVMVMTMLPSAPIHTHATEAGAEDVVDVTEPLSDVTEETIEPSTEATEPAPVCDCGTDETSIHATTCAVYVDPETAVCYCTEKCTEVNVWCDVCGFDYSKCGGTDTAVPYAGAVASVKVGDKTTNYTDLSTALSAAQNNEGSTLTLLQDIDLGTECMDIKSGTFTIDLNGCALYSIDSMSWECVSVNNYGNTISIIDTVGTGSITGDNYAVQVTSGTLNISGVTIITNNSDGIGVDVVQSISKVNIGDCTINAGYNAVNIDDGEVTISGNTNITSVEGYGVFNRESTVTISGGNIHNGVYTDGTTNISGSVQITSDYEEYGAVEVWGGETTISGGTINGNLSGCNGVDVNDGKVTISGGTVTGTAYGLQRKNGSITITGGSISGETADLYSSQSSYVTLTLDEGKTVGATFPGGITVEGSANLANMLQNATYWCVMDGKNTMLLESGEYVYAGSAITDKGDITIRAICYHEDVELDYIITKTAHTSICPVCNWTMGEAENHTGGEATCTAQAVCTTCGKGYGELGGHTPVEDATYIVNDDGTQLYLFRLRRHRHRGSYRRQSYLHNTRCLYGLRWELSQPRQSRI